MKVKEESEKVGLKLNIQKTNIMSSSPITSWEIDGETVETVADFILGGSKITADDDYSHEIKRHLLTESKSLFSVSLFITCILSSVKQITSPGWMHETSAQGWCTGKTQRDGMGREVEGVLGWGNTCKSMADSCQCMARTTTIL